MLPADFIVAERVSCQIQSSSKKKILELLGRLFAGSDPSLSQDVVFDRLLERERLGSTGLGHGIALPHARIRGLERAYGAFVQLSEGVDFDAIDGEPVDLVFGLLVPEAATQEHLQLLANLATLFNEPEFCAELRRAQNPDEVLQLLTQQAP